MLSNECSLHWLSRNVSDPGNSNINQYTLIYADPPYIHKTRLTGRDYYTHEFTTQDHKLFLYLITQLDCKAMISHYDHPLYQHALSRWNTMTVQSQDRGNNMRTEWVWMNYPDPQELHDYRFLGDTYRERERITNRQARWLNNLRQMPRLERLAMIQKINELQ